jgi:hypothetical protein
VNKKKLLFSVSIIFYFLFFLNTANAMPDSITKILEAYKFSLGGSFCQQLECDRASLFFLIPMDKNEQDIEISIYPECIGGFNASEDLSLTIWCSDGTQHAYDMKPDYCAFGSPHLTLPLTINGTGGFVSFGEKQFSQFWCVFIRNITNTNSVPTEFTVLIDGVGMHSKFIDNTTQENIGTQSAMMLTIDNLINLNMSVWRIVYAIFLIGALMVGIFFVLGAVPLAIKWVIRKITED